MYVICGEDPKMHFHGYTAVVCFFLFSYLRTSNIQVPVHGTTNKHNCVPIKGSDQPASLQIKCVNKNIFLISQQKLMYDIVTEYDQETPQSDTVHQPTAPRGRVTEH